MRYKHFLPMLFLFCTTLLWAQSPERPRKEIPLITNVIASIDKAEGWMLQNNGEWIGAKNKIPFRNYAVNKRNSGKYELGQQNFDHIDLRAITINNTIYSILLVYAQAGAYEFPVLEEKWDQYNTLTYYVFEESKWSRILPDSVVFNRPYAINTELVIHGEIDNFSEESYLFEIENKARQAIYQQAKSTSNLIFAAYPVQIRDEKFFRFKLYETINKREIYIKYLLPHNRDKLFKNFYFEMEYADFAAFVGNIGLIDPSRLNDPTYYAHFMNLGIEKFEKEEYRSALQLFVKASMVNPPDSAMIPIFLWKGKAKLKLNSAREALEDFDSVIHRKPTSMQTKNDWLAAHYERGNAYYAMHDYPKACENWNFALQNGIAEAYDKIKKNCDRRAGGMTRPINIEKSEKYYERAFKKYNQKKYLKALHQFEKSWQYNYLTKDFKLPYYIAMCRFQLGDYVRSIDEFDQAAALEPESYAADFEMWSDVFVMRGKAWNTIGYPENACADWYRAKELGNIDGESLLVIHCEGFVPAGKSETDSGIITLENATKLADDGNYKKALAFLQQITPPGQGATQVKYFLYRGNAKHQTGDFVGAIEDFTKAIEVEGENTEWHMKAYFNRGISKFQTGDKSGACLDWQKALELGLKDQYALEYVHTHCKN